MVALQKQFGAGKQIQNAFQTNGILLNDAWCRFLHDNNWLVGLSLDGPADLHDAFRVSRRGNPTHQKVMTALQKLVDADFNQFADVVDKRRVVLTAGNLPVLDVFDAVEYAHDPRTQFLNWSFMTHPSFDYAADARGYSWGVALEYIDSELGWAVRAGRFLQPVESNGLSLDTRFLEHYGDMLELEKSYMLFGQEGKVRLLGVTTAKPVEAVKEVPTIAASGLPGTKGFNSSIWFGIFAPKGTDPAIVKKLNHAVNEVLSQPEVRERFVSQGNTIREETPEQFKKTVHDDRIKWAKVVKDAKISID